MTSFSGPSTTSATMSTKRIFVGLRNVTSRELTEDQNQWMREIGQ